MRRRPVLLLALVLALPGLSACSGGGPITLPTSVPSVSLSTTLPEVTLPTLPEAERTTETPEPTETAEPTRTPLETRTETVTQTATETATQTVTQTATETQTRTATLTATETATLTATPIPVETPTETVTQTVTETATQTPSATPSPTASSAPVEAAPEPTATSGDTTPWWPWVLLALLAIGGLIWLLLRRRAAQQVLDDWDAALAESRGEATWVEESLVTQVLATPTAVEAGQVWTAAAPRLLAIDEALLGLESSAPDEFRRADAADLRARLGRLVEAVGTDTAAGPGSTPDDFRVRRAAIDTARSDLRAVLAPAATAASAPAPDGGSGPGPA